MTAKVEYECVVMGETFTVLAVSNQDARFKAAKEYKGLTGDERSVQFLAALVNTHRKGAKKYFRGDLSEWLR